jgi:ATP-dependent DNA helicase RecG
MAGQQSGTIAERLSILRDSDDGFEIAEKDFSLRGPGDLLGIRQSGDAMFRIVDVTRDGELLKMASSAALSLCETDPGLRAPENSTLKQAITSYMDENNRNLIL